MALSAVLEFGDNNIKRYSKSFLVSDCRFVFSKSHNGVRPNGDTHCERIEIVVIPPGKDDLNLYEWFSSQGVQNGRIVISMAANDQHATDESHILYLYDAQCFSLSEHYSIDEQRRRLLKLGIIASQIVVDDAVFTI